LHGDAGAPADILVVGALVGVLEAAPPADVVDEDRAEVGLTRLDIPNEGFEAVAPVQTEPAFPFVSVSSYDLEPLALRVPSDLIRLVLGGIALMLRRHADILGGPLCPVRSSACGMAE
jgi:hypothetical protein